jgi:hypothetical protein
MEKAVSPSILQVTSTIEFQDCPENPLGMNMKGGSARDPTYSGPELTLIDE